MIARRTPVLRGRAGEREALDRLLGDALAGRSCVLVIRGEAGVGKTALLRYAADRAPGFQVARISGIESELELPFAGLHQLCASLLDRLEALPQPQQAALRVALGLESGDAPDHFLVGLAMLSLLAEVAEEQPLLCLVDDVQWLDGASVKVLGFAARRLLAEPLAIVFAGREPGDERSLAGLPELRLTGLDHADAGALLATVVPGRLDARVRDRIIAETRGNPLALLEVPRGMSAAELGGGFGRPGAVTQAGIEEWFGRRLDGLPADTAEVAAARGGRSRRRAAARVAGGRAARDRPAGRDAGRRCRAAGDRRAGAVPAAVRAHGGLPFGVAGRTASVARRAGSGHGSAARSRPASLAPRPGGARARRAGRRRARALGRARPGTWRHRRRRSLARRRGDAHSRTCPPRAAPARRGSGTARRRRARCGTGAAGCRRGGAGRRSAGRGDRADAGGDRVRPAPRRRGRAAAHRRGPAPGVARCRAGARHPPQGARRGDVGRPGPPVGGGRGRAGRAARPRPAENGGCPARRVRDPRHGRLRPGRAGAAASARGGSHPGGRQRHRPLAVADRFPSRSRRRPRAVGRRRLARPRRSPGRGGARHGRARAAAVRAPATRPNPPARPGI